MDTPAERVHAIIRSAWDHPDRKFGSDLSFYDFEFDRDDVRSRLHSIAVKRDPTLEDLERILISIHEAELVSIRRESEIVHACHERRDDLKVFYVYNTANNKLTVLAKDAMCARRFACYAGHIKDRKNGRVFVLKPEFEAELRRSGKALGRALRDGRPGAVETLGENVVMRGSKKVFTPMTQVQG